MANYDKKMDNSDFLRYAIGEVISMGKIKYVGQLYDNTYRVNMHTHDMWEIVYYTHGQGEVNADGNIIPFAAHDIFIIPPNLPHMDYSDKGFKNYHYTFWDPDFSFSDFSIIKLRDSSHHDFLRILKQLYTEFHIRRNNYERILDSLYDVLYQYILSFSDSMSKNAYVSRIIDDIISHVNDPHYDIANSLKQIPLNDDYFRRLFMQETGKTPLQYLTQKRIDYACRLIYSKQYSRLSFKEIAWRSGFADYYYFSRVFKKVTYFSPAAWEKQYAQPTITPF